MSLIQGCAVSRERPITFNVEMGLAALRGDKTQTRRPVKPQPPRDCVYTTNGAGDRALCMVGVDAMVPSHPWFVPPRPDSADTFVCCPYGTSGDRVRLVAEVPGLPPIYFADAVIEHAWAELVQDASLSGLGREGWPGSEEQRAFVEAGADGLINDDVIEWFAHLWDSIYAARGLGWVANPWVWVVEFKRGAA